MRKSIACGTAALTALLGAAPVPRGLPVTLDVVNASPDVLECHAVAGHWYGFDLGEIAAGAHRLVAMLYDRPSGMIAMANSQGHPVPLQFVYCGRRGDAWRTRSVLPIRARLDRPAPLTCRQEVGILDCN